MNNMNNLLYQLQNFMQNPASILTRRGIPANAFQDPRGAVQQLLNNGQMSQQQLNSMQQAANNIMQNPLFQQMFGRKN